MIFLSLYIISSFVFNAESVAVMSVDLGSEWMKVAIVSVRHNFRISRVGKLIERRFSKML